MVSGVLGGWGRGAHCLGIEMWPYPFHQRFILMQTHPGTETQNGDRPFRTPRKFSAAFDHFYDDKWLLNEEEKRRKKNNLVLERCFELLFKGKNNPFKSDKIYVAFCREFMILRSQLISTDFHSTSNGGSVQCYKQIGPLPLIHNSIRWRKSNIFFYRFPLSFCGTQAKMRSWEATRCHPSFQIAHSHTHTNTRIRLSDVLYLLTLRSGRFVFHTWLSHASTSSSGLYLYVCSVPFHLFFGVYPHISSYTRLDAWLRYRLAGATFSKPCSLIIRKNFMSC